MPYPLMADLTPAQIAKRMDPPAFGQWVRSRRPANTPRGDFIHDVRDDSSFPDAETWEEVERYLRTKGACEACIIAGMEMWAEYWRTFWGY